MPAHIHEVVQLLRCTALPQEGDGLTDGQLLGHFLERRDQAAVAALVRRHGPMVWGVCRRLLSNQQDAEDAFQATFLVLIRKATSVKQREQVGNWLYGVAQQTALKARATASKRQTRERQVTSMPETATPESDAWADLQPALDQELSRLPEMYRVAIVLCDLEGKTRRETARQLGLAERTLAGRLRRGRALLARRLARHGLPVIGAALGTLLSTHAASASVPAPVMTSTIQAATAVAAGQAVTAGLVSAAVATLTEGVIKTMLLNKLKTVTMVLCAVAALGVGAGGVTRGMQAAGQTAAATSRQPQQEEASSAGKGDEKKPVDKEAWTRKLAELAEADRRERRTDAWGIGMRLAELPPDEGFALLRDNWGKLKRVETRQQLLKAWYHTLPYPLHPRNHPRLLDVLDLGMRDRSPEVQRWALAYLREVAFQDLAEDFQAYKLWYQANRRKPVAKVIAESIHRFAAGAAAAQGKEALKRAQFLSETRVVFRDVPAARQAAADSGLLQTLGRWAAAGTAAGARPDDTRLAEQALGVIAGLKPGQAYLRRVVVPLLARDKPLGVRTAAISSLGNKDNAWAVDPLLDVLKGSLAENKATFDRIVDSAAGALGDMDDPRAIPTLIAIIEADNTKVYWVGYFGLGRLTGVRYDEAHNGAWWRQWWGKNKARYPEAVRRLEIPKLGKDVKPIRALPADADVPVLDLRAGGDARKRYFLIGAGKKEKPPAEGYGLLIVLPGGDGSADFHPFVRNIYRKALNKRWLIAQAVAPRWDEKQFQRLVWPRRGLRYPAAKFTTEQFIDAVLVDVEAKAPIDPKRVLLLGWSSGGPPCYSLALRQGSPITGAFIAMSVFHQPEVQLALKNARGKAFYLLQSPDDEVTEFRFAEAAEKVLRAAGARVKLQRYQGGHGWQGTEDEVQKMIADGVTWLEKQGGAKP